MVKILVFDTETSGLPDVKPWEIPITIPITFDRNKKIVTRFKTNQQLSKLSPEEIKDYKNKKKEDINILYQALHSNYETATEIWNFYLNKWTSIIQMSYIMYDTETNETKIYDKYIDLPETVHIDPKSSLITHIYKNSSDIPPEVDEESCIVLSNTHLEKVMIQDCLGEFIKDVKQCQIIVGHNIQFDRNMVISEMIRNNMLAEDVALLMDSSTLQYVCTMKETTLLCMLPAVKEYVDHTPLFYDVDPNNPQTIKYPRLNETYFKIFGYMPNETSLHNSIYDVVITLRIFCMLDVAFPAFDIYGKTSEIDKLLDDITTDVEKRCNFKISQEISIETSMGMVTPMEMATVESKDGKKKRVKKNKSTKSKNKFSKSYKVKNKSKF